MNTPKIYRVVSVTCEEVQEDGTIEIVRLEDTEDFGNAYLRFLFSPEDPRHKFWIATNHDGLNTGNAAIGTPPSKDIPFDAEKIRDRTNQLIGIIQDGNCAVLATYDVPGLGLIFPPKN